MSAKSVGLAEERFTKSARGIGLAPSSFATATVVVFGEMFPISAADATHSVQRKPRAIRIAVTVVFLFITAISIIVTSDGAL